MNITEDSYAMLCICGDLGLSAETDLKPYTVVQWSKMAERLVENQLRPRHLFDLDKMELSGKLGLEDTEIERLGRLTDRAGNLSYELSNLEKLGIGVMTRSDTIYPVRLKERLKKYAPPILFYAGNLALMDNEGVAVVGSRDIDESGTKFTMELARRVTNDGLNIVSGGARGVDSIAEQVANNADGTTVIVLADSMEKRIQQREVREAIVNRNTLILSPFRPDSHFRSFAAMERNKYVYALADYVVIVASQASKGGTWSGAEENRKKNWVPMFVRISNNIPSGNKALLKHETVYPISLEDIQNTGQGINQWFLNKMEQRAHVSEVRQISIFDSVE